jgi:hypothetical protein
MLNLVRLDLSENNLTYIPPGAFHTLVALRQPSTPLTYRRVSALREIFADFLFILVYLVPTYILHL